MLQLSNIAHLYTGTECIQSANISLMGDKILSLTSTTITQSLSFSEALELVALPSEVTIDLQGLNVAPAFIDLQVNGVHGIVFNQLQDVESLRQAALYQIHHGTTLFLPTIITDTPDKTASILQIFQDYTQQYGCEGVAGIHLEGPFINSVKCGTHNAEHIRSLNQEAVTRLIELRQYLPILLTIAPETIDLELLQPLLTAGIVVFAGHSLATETEARVAFQRGIRGVTHLFNAMSQLESRAVNLVGAALDTSNLYISCIPDGYHVNFTTLKLAYRALLGGNSSSKLFAITDAFSADMPEGFTVHIGNMSIQQQQGCYRNQHGGLAGSAINMQQALLNLTQHLEMPLTEALRMVSTYPAQAMGWQDYGYIRENAPAELIIFTDDLEVVAVVHRGQLLKVQKDGNR